MSKRKESPSERGISRRKLLAGGVINALRFELHDTGTVRGMTGDFEAQRGPAPAPPLRKREPDHDDPATEQTRPLRTPER